MDKIILKNKTEFEIAEVASLGNIQIQSKDFDGIKTITDAFSEENISKVTFTHNDQTSGETWYYYGFYFPKGGKFPH